MPRPRDRVIRRGAARTRRGAAGGTAGTTAGRRRHRQTTNSVEIIAVENVPAAAAAVNAANADGGDRGAECVDLTCTADEEFVDLTAANDSPVVVLNSPADDPVPARRQRVHRSPDTTISLSQDSDRSSSTSSDILPALDLDDSLFREDPLQDTAAVAGPSTSNQADFIPIMSPPGGRTKVMCPVCLDSDRQISGDGRNLVSTICGHVFCNQCIRSAINNQHKCPTCRKKLTLKQTHALFI